MIFFSKLKKRPLRNLLAGFYQRVVFSAVSVFLLSLSLSSPAFAQQEETDKTWSQKIFAMDKYAWDPRGGLIYAPFMPVGSIGEIDFGALGVQGYFSVETPLKLFLPLNTLKIRTRMGLQAGYHAFNVNTQTSTGTIGLIPVLFHLSAYYDLPEIISSMNIAASFKWNQGIILSNMTNTVKPEYAAQFAGKPSSISGSYIGYGTQWSLGAEMKVKSMPQIAYFMDYGFLLHTEELSGTFFAMSFGVAYHFFALNKDVQGN